MLPPPPPPAIATLRADTEALLTSLGLAWEAHPGELSWRIFVGPGRILQRCYDLQALPDGSGLLIFYGNTDAGPALHLLRRCVHIPLPPPSLAHLVPVAELVRQVVGHPAVWPPNRYGLT